MIQYFIISQNICYVLFDSNDENERNHSLNLDTKNL